MKIIKKSLTQLKEHSQKVPKKFYSRSKLPFFTLAFTLSALILTVVAVQQQQNLVQNAAEREECPTGTQGNNNNNGNGNDNADGNRGERPDRNATQAAREPTRAAREATRAARESGGTNNDDPDGNSGSAVGTNTRTIIATSGSVRQNPNTNKKISGQLIVKYKKDKSTKTSEEKIAKRKGKVKKRLARLQMDVVQVPTDQEAATIGELRSDPNVESVYNDYLAFIGFTPNDTEYDKLYGMDKIDAPEAWDTTKGKSAIKIAILDTGIDKNHPDLAGKVVAEKNFIADASPADDHGHGTHVAGTAAAIGNNGKGVIGVCPECSLMNAKVMDSSGHGPTSVIIEGVNWAIENDADVINMSLGIAQNRSELQPLEDAIKDATSKGIIVVAIAGNCGDSNYQLNNCSSQNQVVYPGGYEEVITVAATDQNDKRASFSTTGNFVDVSAPGANIFSTAPGGGYKEMHGTSQAAPHVAGLAGLLLSQGLSADEVKNKILSTTDNVPDSGSTKGRINAAKAVGGSTVDPTSATTNPNQGETPKPCHTKKNKDKDKNKNKPTDAKKNDKKNDKKDKKNNGGGYKDRACAIFPYLPFCKGKNDDCLTNPSRNNTNNQNNSSPNSRSGNGRDGQENQSNSPGTTTTGRIDNDGTSNTRITINGQEVQSNGQTGSAEDINTGGQRGGNHETNININRDGGSQTSDQSGGDGNTQTNANRGAGNNSRDKNQPCNTQNNKNHDKEKKNDKDKNNKDKKKDDKDKDKDKKNNGGNNSNPICRIAPWLGMCKNNNNNGNNNKNNNNNNQNNNRNGNNNNGGDNKCKKNSDCRGDRVCRKGKCEARNVKGASTVNIDPSSARNMLDYNILYACMAKEKSCTPELRKASDRNNDGVVNRLDYEALRADLQREGY